jgi:hypothetical protein
MNRWRRGLASAALAGALVVIGACTGQGGTKPPPRGAKPSPLSYDQAVRLIPLNGTKELPLTWRLPEAGTAAEKEATLAAQRYIALYHYLGSLERPAQMARVSPQVATERISKIDVGIYGSSDGNPDPSVGPLWIWMLNMSMDGSDKAFIGLCIDMGWWGDRSRTKDLPRKSRRASLQSIEVQRTQSAGQPPRWKAADFNNKADEKLAPRYAKQCTAWAKHTPPK